jgi:O-antigen/teichoic acid export membrane protein
MEKLVGFKGVAYYSAAFNVVDSIAILASVQLLGGVIFPLLTVLWWKDRDAVGPLVGRTAKWLMAAAFPIMFFLWAESELIIGLVYPAEYKDTVWMQQYMVWLILFSFESNLFAYLMMVAGEAKRLLAISVVVTAINLILNVLLVERFGLVGGCLVIIFTRMTMTLLTFLYCQVRFRFFKLTDFAFPVVLALICLCLFILIKPLVTLHIAVFAALGVYILTVWRLGERFIGSITQKGPSDTQSQLP